MPIFFLTDMLWSKIGVASIKIICGKVVNLQFVKVYIFYDYFVVKLILESTLKYFFEKIYKNLHALGKSTAMRSRFFLMRQ